jgi:uncharacterized membrane protein
LPKLGCEGFRAYPAMFKAAGLGAIAGLRSIAAPALLSRAVRRGDVGGLQGTPFAALGFPKVSSVLQLMMIGEMVVDKMPFVPSRASFLPLLGRTFSGALVGAALFVSEGRCGNSGAVLGAFSALAAAHAGERARTTGTGEVPNAFIGALEDTIVLALGPRLLRNRG